MQLIGPLLMVSDARDPARSVTPATGSDGEGSLSFLGLSVQLPQATWGNMINQARRDIKANFGQVLYPSIILTLTVLALNQVGDFFQRRSAHRGSSF